MCNIIKDTETRKDGIIIIGHDVNYIYINPHIACFTFLFALYFPADENIDSQSECNRL